MLSFMIESRSALSAVSRVQIDGHGHAADHEVRMRIFSSKDRVDLGESSLRVQGLQIMGDRQQINFWRQLISRVPPIGVGKDRKLAAFRDAFDFVLDIREICRRSIRPGRNALLDEAVCAGSALRASTTSTQSRACR